MKIPLPRLNWVWVSASEIGRYRSLVSNGTIGWEIAGWDCSGSSGLRTCHEKTEYIKCKWEREKHRETTIEKINRTDRIKYFEEWIRPNECDKEENKGWGAETELACRLEQSRYNKREVYKAKVRHYNKVIRPERLNKNAWYRTRKEKWENLRRGKEKSKVRSSRWKNKGW